MLVLGIAIGPFAGFAVGLKTEAKTPQQPTNQFVAGRKATLDERAGEMPLTLADASRATAGSPQMADWTSSASASSSPDCRSIAALRPAGPANPSAEMVRAAAKPGQPGTNRAARYRGHGAHRLDTATARRERLACREQPTTALVKKRRYGLKT